jgi:hypothetical protein
MPDFASVSGSFLSPDLARQLQDRLRSITETAAVELHKTAVERAPVRTGKYRASLEVQDQSQGPIISFRVWSKVAYARFIRSAKVGDQRQRSFRAVFTEDLGKPAKVARAKLVNDAAQVAVEVLNG